MSLLKGIEFVKFGLWRVFEAVWNRFGGVAALRETVAEGERAGLGSVGQGASGR